MLNDALPIPSVPRGEALLRLLECALAVSDSRAALILNEGQAFVESIPDTFIPVLAASLSLVRDELRKRISLYQDPDYLNPRPPLIRKKLNPEWEAFIWSKFKLGTLHFSTPADLAARLDTVDREELKEIIQELKVFYFYLNSLTSGISRRNLEILFMVDFFSLWTKKIPGDVLIRFPHDIRKELVGLKDKTSADALEKEVVIGLLRELAWAKVDAGTRILEGQFGEMDTSIKDNRNQHLVELESRPVDELVAKQRNAEKMAPRIQERLDAFYENFPDLEELLSNLVGSGGSDEQND